MLVREAIHILAERAGVVGDPFYSETDLLAALQTAFEVYYHILEVEGRAEILRSLEITPTQTDAPLPPDVRVIRSVWRKDTQRPLVRVPSRSEDFQGDVYDFHVAQDAVHLIIPAPLENVPLVIEYLPSTPQLQMTPSSDPRVWTEIPDSLFPISGIIQRAIAELLAKDRDPAASLYQQLAQDHLQSWIASMRSSLQVTVESPSTIRYVIAQVLALQNKLHPDYANERQVVALIQRAVEAIHRRIEILAERLLRVAHQQPISGLPVDLTITTPMANVLSVYVRRDGIWWATAWGDRYAPEFQRGTFFDWTRTTSGSIQLKVWTTDPAPGAADQIIVLGISPPPTVSPNSSLDPHLYPPSLILDFCLAEGLDDPSRSAFHLQRFENGLALHAQLIRDRMVHRDMPHSGTRARAVAMLRQMLGSSGQGAWATTVMESFIDLARAEISRRIRSLTQDFFVRDFFLPAAQRLTMPEPWIEIIGVYWYPAGRSSPHFVRELIHGDRHDPTFSWVFGLWDNDGKDIVLSGFPGVQGGEILVRAVQMPEALAGRLDATDIESFLYPEDVLVSQALALILASPRAEELSTQGPLWISIAERKLNQHIAELARAFRRSVRRRLPPLRINPPWQGAL